MELEVASRRREALLLLLSAVCLGVFVNVLSGFVTETLNELQRWAAITVASIGVTVFVVTTYVAVLTRREKGILQARLVFCFDRSRCAFVDIPRCPPSVIARVHFSRLSESRRHELAEFNDWRKFFGSDFDDFVNEAVQAILVRFLIQENVSAAPPSELFKFEQMPEAIKRNGCLRREAQALPYEQFRLPTGVTLSTFGPYERFLRLSSRNGHVEVSWEIGRSPTAFETEAYIAALGLQSRAAAQEFIIDVTFAHEFRFIRLHSRELDAFAAWVLSLRQRLAEIDWQRTVQLLPVVLLGEIIRRMNTQVAASVGRAPQSTAAPATRPTAPAVATERQPVASEPGRPQEPSPKLKPDRSAPKLRGGEKGD